MQNNKFNNGDLVYLVTDPYQFKRMITGIKFNLGGSIMYEVSIGSETSVHYEQEIYSEVNNSLKLGYDKKEE